MRHGRKGVMMSIREADRYPDGADRRGQQRRTVVLSLPRPDNRSHPHSQTSPLFRAPNARGNQGSMRGRAKYIVVILLVLWLAAGVAAAFQRGYFQGSSATCAQTSTILVTVLAGPLNYLGVNPTIDCTLPQPSP